MAAWLQPLESNPEVMNKYLHKLGVPNKWQLVDVYGLDADLLAVVPRPVLALVLLFPCSVKYEEYRAAQEADLVARGSQAPANVFFLKQFLRNACGTIALIHSVANSADRIELVDGHLKRFLAESVALSPEDRGALLQTAQGIIDAHRELALEGQTAVPGADDEVPHHFIAFVHKDGSLYELDGRKSLPVNHGASSEETLLEDAAKVCKEYMDRDPENLNFTMVALTAND